MSPLVPRRPCCQTIMAWQAQALVSFWLSFGRDHSVLWAPVTNTADEASRCRPEWSAPGQISWLPEPTEAHQTGAMPRNSKIPPPTLEEMRQAAPWQWVNCRNPNCLHRAPFALTPLIIRWGADASSDQLRQNARCNKCGKRGADLRHPSARDSDLALAYHSRAEHWGSPLRR
jgi:hypothetical protein